MKTIKKLVTIMLFSMAAVGFAQEDQKNLQVDKEDYYTKRAKEDAKFEQSFNAQSKSDEKKFWKEQKAYEKELKSRDKIAHEAYMQGKKDAYAAHNNHCNEHCNHGYYYKHHVHYYYHNDYEYRRRSNRSATGTRIRVRAPSISLGLF